MNPTSAPRHWTIGAKALDLAKLFALAALGVAPLAATFCFAPDRLWDRPVSLEVLSAWCMLLTAPALGVGLYWFLRGVTKMASADTAPPSQGELRAYRTWCTLFGGAPMLYGLASLVAWYRTNEVLARPWIFLTVGLMGLAYALALVAVVTYSQRHQRGLA